MTSTRAPVPAWTVRRAERKPSFAKRTVTSPGATLFSSYSPFSSDSAPTPSRPSPADTCTSATGSPSVPPTRPRIDTPASSATSSSGTGASLETATPSIIFWR